MPSNKIIGGTPITDADPMQTGDAAIAGSSDAYDVTPNNSADLPHGVCRGIYVGVSGHVKMDMENGTTVTRQNVAAGMSHPWRAKRIYATGTTATGIIADY